MPHEHQGLYKSLAAIVAIVILEGIAILQGVDGVALAAAIAALAGLGGFAVGKATSAKAHVQT